MKLRLQITKEREIRFISHLEYLRTIGRAIRRAKLPAAYSEGFNPHLKFSLASALSVGVVSYAEFVEIELTRTVDIKEAALSLSKALPRGIRVIAADMAENKEASLMSKAAGATYKVMLQHADGITEAVARYNAAEFLYFKKPAPKTKEKYKEIDVKKFIPAIKIEQYDSDIVLIFDCVITPNGSMKAADLLRALNEEYDLQLQVEAADIERLELYKFGADGAAKQPLLGESAVRI